MYIFNNIYIIKYIIILFLYKDMKTILNYITFMIFIILICIIALLISWKISINNTIWNTTIWINQHLLEGIQILNCEDEGIENNTFKIILEEKNIENSWDWITFISILSTLLAAFFIYSSWKIDNDLRKISDVKHSIEKIEDAAIESTEFSLQLKYSIHYMMSKQYKKAIDALIVLRSESFTLRDDRKLNSCNYFLAVCYYEQWLIDDDEESIAMAVQFIDEAIEDDNHPLKNEIINKFNEMQEHQS